MEPESVLENQNKIKMSIPHAPDIRRDSIPFLFHRFVLILREYILENVIVLTF